MSNTALQDISVVHCYVCMCARSLRVFPTGNCHWRHAVDDAGRDAANEPSKFATAPPESFKWSGTIGRVDSGNARYGVWDVPPDDVALQFVT